MDSELFLQEIIERLLEESLQRMRALNDEVFNKEFALEGEKRGQFRNSADRALQRFHDDLRILFGSNSLPEPLAAAIADLVEEADLFWQEICQVIDTARLGCEIGSQYVDERQRSRNRIQSIGVKTRAVKDQLSKSLTDASPSASVTEPN